MLLLTFLAGPNRYAIDVTWVVEVVPRVELRSIPHSPDYLSGLLGYRGGVVPVVDLGVLLGSEPCHDRLSTRIILVKERLDSTAILGVIADHVSDLAYVQPTDLLPAPVHVASAPYLGEVVKTDGGFVQMIDVIKMRASIEV